MSPRRAQSSPLGRLLPSLPDLPWCRCLDRVAPRAGLRDILDECGEILREPSRDELSDIAFGVGRFLGSLTGSRYVRVPLAGLHIEKITARMQEHGCVRSKRHLRDGTCPSS